MGRPGKPRGPVPRHRPSAARRAWPGGARLRPRGPRLRPRGPAIGILVIGALAMGALAPAAVTPRAAGGPDLETARRSLAQQRYVEAHAVAAALLESPEPAEARAARIIAAQALLGLGQADAAVQLLGRLRTDRPPEPEDGDWVPVLAAALEAQGSFISAADWWLTYAGFGDREREEGRRRLEPLFASRLSPAEIAYLRWKHPHESAVGPAPAARAGDDFFTVGVLAPLNGRYAQFGLALANGVDTARRLHNARARFPLRLEIADTGGSPAGCLDAVARMHARGVRVFLGEVFSLHTLMAAAFLHERGAVLISPAATDSTVGLLGPGTYTCRAAAHEQLAALAAYAADSLGLRGVAVHRSETAAGRRWTSLFTRAAAERGLPVVAEHVYAPGADDFWSAPGGEPIDAAGPGRAVPEAGAAVFCSGTLRDLAGLLREFAEAGFTGPFLGPPELGGPVLSALAAELGLTVIYPGDTFVSAAARAGETRFEDAFRDLFGEEPDAFARRGWIAFAVLAEAIEAGGYCMEALESLLERSAAPALARGEERRLAVPPATGSAAVYVRAGAELRAVGLPRGPAGRSAETETAPPR